MASYEKDPTTMRHSVVVPFEIPAGNIILYPNIAGAIYIHILECLDISSSQPLWVYMPHTLQYISYWV